MAVANVISVIKIANALGIHNKKLIITAIGLGHISPEFNFSSGNKLCIYVLLHCIIIPRSLLTLGRWELLILMLTENASRWPVATGVSLRQRVTTSWWCPCYGYQLKWRFRGSNAEYPYLQGSLYKPRNRGEFSLLGAVIRIMRCEVHCFFERYCAFINRREFQDFCSQVTQFQGRLERHEKLLNKSQLLTKYWSLINL